MICSVIKNVINIEALCLVTSTVPEDRKRHHCDHIKRFMVAGQYMNGVAVVDHVTHMGAMFLVSAFKHNLNFLRTNNLRMMVNRIVISVI